MKLARDLYPSLEKSVEQLASSLRSFVKELEL